VAGPDDGRRSPHSPQTKKRRAEHAVADPQRRPSACLLGKKLAWKSATDACDPKQARARGSRKKFAGAKIYFPFSWRQDIYCASSSSPGVGSLGPKKRQQVLADYVRGYGRPSTNPLFTERKLRERGPRGFPAGRERSAGLGAAKQNREYSTRARTGSPPSSRQDHLYGAKAPRGTRPRSRSTRTRQQGPLASNRKECSYPITGRTKGFFKTPIVSRPEARTTSTPVYVGPAYQSESGFCWCAPYARSGF